MTSTSMKSIGHFAFRDTGAPAEKEYTTLVLLHGFAWHSGVFARMLPYTGPNARIILVNRRDYPGSSSISDAERAPLDSANASDPEGAQTIGTYMKERAQDFHDFLEALVVEEQIPPCSMVVADPPYHAIGYPPPNDFYNPLTHPSLPPGEGVKLFPAWVSGYYLHGDSPSLLEHRIALEDPKPTILSMSSDDLQDSLFNAPAIPGGSDDVLMHAGIRHGLWSAIREGALYIPVSGDARESDWDGIELRYIWCDQSVWEMPWGTWALQAELDNAKNSGRPLRNISLTRLTGANHFVSR
ncbi:hypothetical protein EIP86_001386 [Pleurotus ostreatoroseus]|nr:hypothetical protein EIP86_001386 [Pleurotus ostreatoroseus]